MKKHRFLIPLILFVFVACSSAPKRIMLVTENTNFSYSQLENANASIVEGKYARAYSLLSSAYNLALSVDNTELLCKIMLSGVVFKIACPNLAELIPATELENSAASKSFLTQTKEELLASAKNLANRSNEKEKKSLSNLCVIYDVRVQLENEKASSSELISSQNEKTYLAMLETARSGIAKEPYYTAYLCRTKGDVCMAAGDFQNAQKNYAEAAKIHTKERYLVEIGLDWYCLARSYSLGGKKNEALSAIQTALKYDKDAENTAGIASDYLAYSKILLKGNPTEEEKKLSAELSAWSEKILVAGE